MQGLLGTLRTMQGLQSNACSHAGTPVLLPLPPYKWVPCAHDAKPALSVRYRYVRFLKQPIVQDP